MTTLATKSEAPAKDPAVVKAEAAAADAASKLRLILVTATRKVRIDSPHAAWSLNEGANAFEGEIPKEVASVYAKLVEEKAIEIGILDASGKSVPLALKPE